MKVSLLHVRGTRMCDLLNDIGTSRKFGSGDNSVASTDRCSLRACSNIVNSPIFVDTKGDISALQHGPLRRSGGHVLGNGRIEQGRCLFSCSEGRNWTPSFGQLLENKTRRA